MTTFQSVMNEKLGLNSRTYFCIYLCISVYKCLADAMFLLTAGGQAGGDGRHQHSTETQRVQPGTQSENREQRDAEGDAEGERRQVEHCDKEEIQSHHQLCSPNATW